MPVCKLRLGTLLRAGAAWCLAGCADASAPQASDWLDGWLARRYDPAGVGSAVGSYLDPLADKVLVGCVAGALLAKVGAETCLAGAIRSGDVAQRDLVACGIQRCAALDLSGLEEQLQATCRTSKLAVQARPACAPGRVVAVGPCRAPWAVPLAGWQASARVRGGTR